jgi:hypothetical protein
VLASCSCIHGKLIQVDTSTVDAAYSQVIGLIADSAQDHVKLADAIGAQVVEVLKSVEKRHDDAKKKVRSIVRWV